MAKRLCLAVALALVSGALGFAQAPERAFVLSENAGAMSAAAPGAEAGVSQPDAKASDANTSDANAGGANAGEAPPAQRGGGGGNSEPGRPAAPMAATTGTMGLFTLETGELLPKHGWSVSGYASRFARMPGSVWILETGANISYGVTDRLSLYADFQPYGHTHADAPTELRAVSFSAAAGYVEDYPYLTAESSGVGTATLGVKFGLLSESHGAPVSLSIRNDFILPTINATPDLVADGTQTGEFNDRVTLALSKRWGNAITLTFNAGYEITRDPRSGGVVVLRQADQVLVGAGYILFPQRRVQIISEYSGVIFVGAATPNSTFGARDPIDSVSGVRLYPARSLAIDIGYRYMLNLKQADDRDGFVVKLGWTHAESRPAQSPNRSPVVACSADKTTVAAGSNDAVTITTRGGDPDGDPLRYSWSATGGRVDGTGAQVRWLPAGAAPGSYTVTVTVDDGRGGSTVCSVNPTVR